MTTNSLTPVITVRLIGVKPETVPVGAMADLIAAIQSLGGHDLRLLKVKRTSAAYQLTTPNEPCAVVSNIRRFQAAFADPDRNLESRMLKPFDSVSSILNRLNCSMQIFTPDKSVKWEVKQNQWEGIRSRYCIEDEAILIGELKRVGGATVQKCMIRVPYQNDLFYCDIAHPDVARRLGPHLYSDVELRGRGRFFIKDWRLIHFTVSDFVVRKHKTFEEHYLDARRTGGDAWDKIANVAEFVEELR